MTKLALIQVDPLLTSPAEFRKKLAEYELADERSQLAPPFSYARRGEDEKMILVDLPAVAKDFKELWLLVEEINEREPSFFAGIAKPDISPTQFRESATGATYFTEKRLAAVYKLITTANLIKMMLGGKFAQETKPSLMLTREGRRTLSLVQALLQTAEDYCLIHENGLYEMDPQVYSYYLLDSGLFYQNLLAKRSADTLQQARPDLIERIESLKADSNKLSA